ncbi:MAG: hypothetical protein EZS28_009941 [Streblomastix strix]|uniref:Uncharacterized protein n=1 Tax=Streblomastix strix TaxID=222440 RepID=A0A5J4WIK1_9EUKA|nr:MAG: hypothetical protein EZS28_009941 [Streblomastix strix]
MEMMEQEQLYSRFQIFESAKVDLLSQVIEDQRTNYVGEFINYIAGTDTTSSTVEFFNKHISSPEDYDAFME